MQLAGRENFKKKASEDARRHSDTANFYLVRRKNYMQFVSDALQELIGLIRLLQETC